jgi:hypothetical protein
MLVTKKSPTKKVWTFLDGGTPQVALSQSRKLTISKATTIIRTRKTYGTRSGTPYSGPR